MPLPSQSARPLARRSYMYRRSRRRRLPRPAVFVVIAVLGLIALLIFWPGGDEPAGAIGAPPDDAAGRTALTETNRTRDRETTSPADEEPDREAERSTARSRGSTSAPESEFGEIEMGRPMEEAPVLARAGEMVDPVQGPDAASTPPAPLVEEEWERPENASSPAEARVLDRVERGFALIQRNEPVEARRMLTEALDAPQLGEDVKAEIRAALTAVNERLVFSPAIHPDDPFAIEYRIQSGDALSMLPKKLGVLTDWRFAQRINRIRDPRRIQVGQRLKLVTGPFHAEIDKSDYRLDLYLDDGEERAYVCSFPVGLGEYDQTPEGRFIVRPRSKLLNPEWRDPRTRKLYYANDPDNPIGEHWIGLKASEERLEGVNGYGIHGTIEPESIGQQASMGCVRMLADDVAIVWEALAEDVSRVVIHR